MKYVITAPLFLRPAPPLAPNPTATTATATTATATTRSGAPRSCF